MNGRIPTAPFAATADAALFRAVLPAVDAVLAQTEGMRQRFLEIGAGNGPHPGQRQFQKRFRCPPRPARLARAVPAPPPEASQVWVAASTMPPAAPGDPDEDDEVIAAFQTLAQSRPGLMLLLARASRSASTWSPASWKPRAWARCGARKWTPPPRYPPPARCCSTPSAN